MTPHRAPTVASIAIDSFRSLAALPIDPAGALGALVLSWLAWGFGPGNMGVLAVAGCAMLLDLLVGAFKASLDPDVDFTVERLYGGFLGKMFRSLLIPTASLIDWLIIVSPVPLSDSAERTFPVVMLTAFGLAGAELSSTLRKFRGSGVAPGLLDMLAQALGRTQAALPPQPAPPPKPEDRHAP